MATTIYDIKELITLEKVSEVIIYDQPEKNGNLYKLKISVYLCGEYFYNLLRKDVELAYFQIKHFLFGEEIKSRVYSISHDNKINNIITVVEMLEVK